MVVVALVLLALVALWVRARRRRAVQLAALTADKPAFSIEPPRRSMSARKFDAL